VVFVFLVCKFADSVCFLKIGVVGEFLYGVFPVALLIRVCGSSGWHWFLCGGVYGHMVC